MEQSDNLRFVSNLVLGSNTQFVDVRFCFKNAEIKTLGKMARELNLSLYEMIKKIVADKITEAK